MKIHHLNTTKGTIPDIESQEVLSLSLKDFKITIKAEEIYIPPSAGYEGMRHQSLHVVIDHPNNVLKQALDFSFNDFLQDYLILNEGILPETTREAYSKKINEMMPPTA